MKTQQYKIWLLLSLLTAFWMGSAHAVTVEGIAVAGGGAGNTAMVGIDPTLVDPPHTGKIKYFIPLRGNEPGEIYSGTYGDTSDTDIQCSDDGIGTCSDKGTGNGFANADSLQMNIFFDLTGEPESVAANLWFNFDDLDLFPTNDPEGFRESLKLSYWDVVAGDFIMIGDVIDTASGLTSGDFSGAANTDPLPDDLLTPNEDPIMWELDLAALSILSDLNDSADLLGGFWIQLGFGSEFVYTSGKWEGEPRKGWNTPEYLVAQLHVSPVPIPSAVWLFGSALIGFIGMSRRTRV